MFHLMLALPVLAAFGVAALAVIGAVFWGGTILQILMTALGTKRWHFYLPAVLSLFPAVGTLLFFDLSFVLLIFWTIYFLWLWLIRFIISRIRN